METSVSSARLSAASKAPPQTAADMPRRRPEPLAISVAASATPTVYRAPYRMRLSMSRPR